MVDMHNAGTKPGLSHQAGMSRRGFLAVAAAGGALAASGLWVGRAVSEPDYPASAHRHLDARAQAVVRRLMTLWLPAAPGQFPSAASLPVLTHVDHGLGQLDSGVREQFLDGVAAFEMAAIVYGWHGAVFSQLGLTDAHAYIERWGHGQAPQRALIGGLRLLICPAYWREPASWPATGYQGPIHQRAEIPALGDAPEPERS